jgi:hypothetical protein
MHCQYPDALEGVLDMFVVVCIPSYGRSSNSSNTLDDQILFPNLAQYQKVCHVDSGSILVSHVLYFVLRPS